MLKRHMTQIKKFFIGQSKFPPEIIFSILNFPENNRHSRSPLLDLDKTIMERVPERTDGNSNKREEQNFRRFTTMMVLGKRVPPGLKGHVKRHWGEFEEKHPHFAAAIFNRNNR